MWQDKYNELLVNFIYRDPRIILGFLFILINEYLGKYIMTFIMR